MTASPYAAPRSVMTFRSRWSMLFSSTLLTMAVSRLDPRQAAALDVRDQLAVARQCRQHPARERGGLAKEAVGPVRVVSSSYDSSGFWVLPHSVQHILIACRGKYFLDPKEIVAGGRQMAPEREQLPQALGDRLRVAVIA